MVIKCTIINDILKLHAGPLCVTLHFITLACHANVIYNTIVVSSSLTFQRNIIFVNFEVLTQVWLRIPFFGNVTVTGSYVGRKKFSIFFLF
jgi:hypothetical protein